MKCRFVLLGLMPAIAVVMCAQTGAEPKLPALFSDHMVLQRGARLPVWGWADPGEPVRVKLLQQEQNTTADEKGRWRVMLEPIACDHAVEMTVTSPSRSITIRDILVGEVWLCSGQSNMQWPLRASLDAKREICEAEYPRMRLFTVEMRASATPLDDVSGKWVICSPKNVAEFSAVGYFFGRELHRTLKTPVGLINSSWGGTTAEAWTDVLSLRSDPLLKPILDRYELHLPQFEAARKEFQTKLSEWREVALQKDPGNTKLAEGWAGADFDDGAWKQIDLPARFEDATSEAIDGAVWFRRKVSVPESLVGKDLAIELGVVDDFDVTYFNGEQVGATGAETPMAWNARRRYPVPARLVRGGANVIAVRCFDTGGPGGLIGPAEKMLLRSATRNGEAPTTKIPLAGQWKCAVEHRLEPKQHLPPPPVEPVGPNTPHAPSNLFNAMIHPLAPFAIKGVIWYQGESNAGRACQYRTLLPSMIKGWRGAWQFGKLHFLIVQLPNFRAVTDDANAPSDWAELREAQLLSARSVPDCAVAVTIDVGDTNDIHPRNKQDVGKRLALLAQKEVYGRDDIVCSGPLVAEVEFKNGKAIIHFDHAGRGLKAKDGSPTLKGFAVAGADRKFVWADAKIESGDRVIVSSDKVPEPVAVRYAWADSPEPSLYNSEGLPASPFRTDDWPGVTTDRR
jgi:sialate O-acetylesterase